MRVNNALGCCSTEKMVDYVSSSANNLTGGLYIMGCLDIEFAVLVLWEGIGDEGAPPDENVNQSVL